MSNLNVTLGDKVKVKLKDHSKNQKNLNIGTVVFYGSVESHKGEWYGIVFDSSIGKNDGTYKKRTYFECESNHGCFVQYDQILKIISKSKDEIQIYLNSAIQLPPPYGIGTVRFAGLAAFNPGIWYGIELNKIPKSHNNNSNVIHSPNGNGTVDGVQYFKCDQDNAYVIFRRKEDLYDVLSHTNPSLNLTTKNKKKLVALKFKKSESAPFCHSTRDKLPPLMDSSTNPEIQDMSNSENENEIQENNNDHSNESNETKEEDYDYPKLMLINDINASDDMYVDEQDNLKKKSDGHGKRRSTGTSVIMIAESDTSDIDDNIFGGAAALEEDVNIKAPKPIKATLHISLDTEQKHNTYNIYDNNNNVSAYIEHLQGQNIAASPKSYKAPNKSRSSIKKLRSLLTVAGNTPPQPHTSKKKATFKEHNLPIKMEHLAMEYSTSLSLEINDDDVCQKRRPNTMAPSKSVPPAPIIISTTPPIPLNSSQSARNSPTERDRALTFPTMALNTDNASKISAATPSQQTFKVVVMGRSRVGKTAIIRRFVKNKFFSHYKMTLGAAQWHFKCEVPIDLLEEIEEDKNMMNSLVFDVSDSNKKQMEQIKEENPSQLSLGFEAMDTDPWDEEDKNAEFGAEYDYGMDDNDNYKLSHMDNTPTNEVNVDDADDDKLIINKNNLHVGLFDYHSNKVLGHNGDNKSITDYGQFTMPEVDINHTDKDIRKISMKLQITLDIVDMGFHPTEEELFNDINAIILVVDCSKKSSIQDAIDKYQTFLKNSLFFKSKKRKRKRARSHSNTAKENIKREYIPLIFAMNKCEMKKTKKQFKKKELRKILFKKLSPIIDQHFPESDAEDDGDADYKMSEMSDEEEENNDKQRRNNNATLLQPPTLSFIYDEGDGKGSDSEYEDSDEEETQESDFYENKQTIKKKNTKKSSDLLSVVRVYHANQISSPGDPFNTPRGNDKKKRKKKKRKKIKRKKRDKNDIRYVDIINCSAKTGKNVEKLFGTCIKKTIPYKLTKSCAHKRTKTTAHVTAPIWLRQVVAEFQINDSNENHPFFEHTPTHSEVDDNFRFLGDGDNSD